MKEWRMISTISIGLILIVGLFFPATSGAETLVWDASSGIVDGYNVYYGTTPSDRSNHRNAGKITQFDLNALPLSAGVTYYLYVSAYNSMGESPPCAPVVFIPGDNTPPSAPIGLTAQ